LDGKTDRSRESSAEGFGPGEWSGFLSERYKKRRLNVMQSAAKHLYLNSK
jgi:hypothetical protein